MRRLHILHRALIARKGAIQFYLDIISIAITGVLSILLSYFAVAISREQAETAKKTYILEMAKSSPWFRILELSNNFPKNDFKIITENINGLSNISGILIQSHFSVSSQSNKINKICSWMLFSNYMEFERERQIGLQNWIKPNNSIREINHYTLGPRFSTNSSIYFSYERNIKKLLESMSFLSEVNANILKLEIEKKFSDDTLLVSWNSRMRVSFLNQVGEIKTKDFIIVDGDLIERPNIVVESNRALQDGVIGAILFEDQNISILQSPKCSS